MADAFDSLFNDQQDTTAFDPFGDTAPVDSSGSFASESYDRAELEGLVRRYLDLAKSDENKPEKRAERWRKYIALEAPKRKPWPDAPGIVTPLIRQKADGVRAHIQAALDQDPMFVINTEPQDTPFNRSDLERLMQESIRVTNSRVEIMRAVRDAVEVGTGHIKHVVYRDATGKFVVASKYVPFEDIYVYPSRRTRTNAINYFERYAEARHVILANAEAGIYEKQPVDDLLGGMTEDELNEVEELWEVWIWYKGRVWEVRYHETAGILAARPSVWWDFLTRAPYDPIYIEPSQTSYWGDSISQILEGLQQVSDAAFNAELAHAQYKLNPPRFVRSGSPAFAYLAKRKFLRPGELVPAGADPRADMFSPIEQMSPFSTQLLTLANQLTEEATFSDMLVPGTPTGGSRKTATEVNFLASSGNLKLTNYYRNVVYALNQHANTKWQLLVAYSPELNGLNAGAYSWEVNGKDSMTEKQMRVQRLQQLMNPAFLQAVVQAAQNPVMQALVTALIAEMDLPGVERAVREVIQASGLGVPNQNVQAQPQAVPGAPGPMASSAPGNGLPG